MSVKRLRKIGKYVCCFATGIRWVVTRDFGDFQQSCLVWSAESRPWLHHWERRVVVCACKLAQCAKILNGPPAAGHLENAVKMWRLLLQDHSWHDWQHVGVNKRRFFMAESRTLKSYLSGRLELVVQWTQPLWAWRPVETGWKTSFQVFRVHVCVHTDWSVPVSPWWWLPFNKSRPNSLPVARKHTDNQIMHSL